MDLPNNKKGVLSKYKEQEKAKKKAYEEEQKINLLIEKAFKQAQKKAEEEVLRNEQKKEQAFGNAKKTYKHQKQVNDQKLGPDFYSSITEKNLIIYDIFEKKPMPIELKQLNHYVKCLQSQIFERKSISRDEKLLQQSLSEGTVRIQGLFDMSNSLCVNMLLDNDNKIAIKASEGNPNGTLACSLLEALRYLTETPGMTKNNIKKNKENIEKIYSTSRGSTGKKKDDVKEGSEGSEGSESSLSKNYKDFGDELLTNFWTKITKSKLNTEEKLKWIMRVYGPLLNKGLSDISQAGELAKYYILKFLEEKSGEKEGDNNSFWETTSGRPTLAAFSSDIIASALGVRIQNIFKGQFQSILPRKIPNSRTSVIYIPYKYIGLMEVLSGRSEMPGIIKITNNFLEDFIKATHEINLPSGNIFSNDFFIKIRDLVNNIYKYYKLNDTKNTFSKNILKIIDEIIVTNENGINFNDNRNKAYIFINIINSFNIFELIYNKSQNKSQKICFKESLEIVKQILIAFGNFIKNLKDFVDKNENIEYLINIVEQKMNMAKQEKNEILFFPSWTGTLYSTISYYDNCLNFNDMSDENLLELYLNISETEESCAEQDTDYGHDQNIDKIQEIGIKVANEWLNKGEQNDLRNIKKQRRETISKTPDSFSISSDVSTSNVDQRFDQRDFSKNLIDKLQYCSVVLTYDINGEPILQTNITTKPDEDYMFSFELPGSFATRYANNIEPIGNMETWASIDYTVGDPLITKTKHALKESFTHTEFIEYIKTENMIEIRTPATNFDAAAPSGCLFKTTEKMCVSYRRFTPIPGQKEQKEYMYVILTYDLDDKYKNNLDLNEESCILKNQPKNLFIGDTILPKGNKITNLMIDFTAKYEYGNKSNNAWRTMWNLLNDYYITSNSELKQIFGNKNYRINILFIQEIEQIFNHMDSLRKETINNKSKFSIFRKDSVENLLLIIEKIGNYYKENCIEYDDNEGTSETKGDDSQQNIKCELVKKLLKMLVESNRKTITLQSDSKKEIEKEDPVTSFLETIKNNTEYRELLEAAYAIIEVGEMRVPTYEVDKIVKMFTPPDRIRNYIKRYTKINNEIIDKVQKLIESVNIEINIEIIERALNYARMITQENGVNFENLNIENKVLCVIYVINQLTETDYNIVYNIDDNTNEEINTSNNIKDDNKNKKRVIKSVDKNEQVKKTAKILTELKRSREEDTNYEPDEADYDMDEEEKNDDRAPLYKKQKNFEENFEENFGGKIKTKKIHKKYKHKLTKRKINHQNKKTRHKLKKRKKNTRRNK